MCAAVCGCVCGSSLLRAVRRRWDYFVTHLLGATPPENYEIGAAKL